jgi:hypothetical protein
MIIVILDGIEAIQENLGTRNIKLFSIRKKLPLGERGR